MRRWLQGATFGAAIVVMGAGCGDNGTPLVKRQAEVRSRGQEVMPFDLKRTTHVFASTTQGGVQSVLIKTAADRDQLPLIRLHLRKEQRLFSQGNFQDPMAIHGMQMPGIDALRRRSSEVTITYRSLPRGAQLRYTTRDPTLRIALHEWFAAQLMDHGADARREPPLPPPLEPTRSSITRSRSRPGSGG
jgi:hypothetical protein